MGDLTARIRAKFSRRNSTTPSVASSTNATVTPGSRPRSNASSQRGKQRHQQQNASPCVARLTEHGDERDGDNDSGDRDKTARASSCIVWAEDRPRRPDSIESHSPSAKLARHPQRDSDGNEHDADHRDHHHHHDRVYEHHDRDNKGPIVATSEVEEERDENKDDRRAAIEADSEDETPAATPSAAPPAASSAVATIFSAPGPEDGGGAGADSASGNDLHRQLPLQQQLQAPSATANVVPADSTKLQSINELPSPPNPVIAADPHSFSQEYSTDTGPADSTTDDDDPLSLSPYPGTPTPRPNVGSTPTGQTFSSSSAASYHLHDGSRYSATPQTPSASASRNYTLVASSPTALRPGGELPRRQSIIPARQTSLIRTLLSQAQADNALDGAASSTSAIAVTPGGTSAHHSAASEHLDGRHADHGSSIGAGADRYGLGSMMTRKVWVRRPGASATMVTVNEDDVIDDVRDLILRKYGNSLGRQFDAPDLSLRIVPREQRAERTLGPEEPVGRTLDAYFPGGQQVDEALIIDVPLVRQRITPRASPRAGPPHAPHLTSASVAAYYAAEDMRPSESGTDYFGPVATASSAHLPVTTLTAPSTGSSHPHTISVLSTGQVPQIPSPGSARSRTYRERPDRPRLGRQHTSSPTIINIVGGQHPPTSHPVDQSQNVAPSAPPIPTPPVAEATSMQQQIGTPPVSQQAPSALPAVNPTPTNPARVGSPRPTPQQQQTQQTQSSTRVKKSKKSLEGGGGGVLGGNGSVPPINVLIVEDNIINLKLLEAFVKRLKVRWQTAMNGRDAVTKWRTGGFHLVLMDIQLPVMSGLDATREIRRLERVNGIGVFSSLPSSASSTPDGVGGKGKGKDKDGVQVVEKKRDEKDDKLGNIDMFKSPVIIVALTASSLQSDRHEALAAGCNDFLTKPVNFVWLERKVMEWGCMQALIDFDGWRKWKDFQKSGDGAGDEAVKKAAAKAKAKKRQSLNSAASTSSAPQQPQAITAGGDV